jgi:hypothetical protein
MRNPCCRLANAARKGETGGGRAEFYALFPTVRIYCCLLLFGLTLVHSTGGSQCQLRHAIVLRGTLLTRAVSSADFDEGLFTRGRFAGGLDMRGVRQPSERRSTLEEAMAGGTTIPDHRFVLMRRGERYFIQSLT